MKSLRKIEMLDITGANEVEIEVRHDNSVIWVNVDGVCALRICRIKRVTLIGSRPSKIDIGAKK